MRLSPSLFAVLLCLGSAGFAHAQQAAAAGSIRQPSASTNSTGGLNFAYDAQHDQITGSGFQLSTNTVKANATAPTTGTVNVTINIKQVSHFAKGTTFHCSVYLLGGIIDLTNGLVDGGVETAYGVGKTSTAGASACTLSIPYSWTLAHDPYGDTGLILAFGASAVGAHTAGEHGDVYRSTLQIDGIENLPASGSTVSYAFDVAL